MSNSLTQTTVTDCEERQASGAAAAHYASSLTRNEDRPPSLLAVDGRLAEAAHHPQAMPPPPPVIPRLRRRSSAGASIHATDEDAPSSSAGDSRDTSSSAFCPPPATTAPHPHPATGISSIRRTGLVASSLRSSFRASRRNSSAFSRGSDGDNHGNGTNGLCGSVVSSSNVNSSTVVSSGRRSSSTEGSWSWARLARRRSYDSSRRGSTSDDSGGGEGQGSDTPVGRCVRVLSSFVSRLKSCSSNVDAAASQGCQSLSRHCRKAANHPRTILLPTLFTFAVLTAAGLSVIIWSARNYRREQTASLVEEGRGAAYELNDVLEKALLPLFTLQEMAGQVKEFRELPSKFDLRETTFRDGGRAFRNTTDLCSDPEVLGPYERAAASIARSAKMGRTLLNVQLQPRGVVCLTHPRTTVYPSGMIMDNTRAVGLDRVRDSLQGRSARLSIEEKARVAVTGPITLVQDTAPAPHETLIYWAPIFVEGVGEYLVTPDDGPTYEDFWGFAGVLVDWDEALEEVGMYEFFESRGMTFAIVEEKEDGTEDKVVASSRDAEPPTRNMADGVQPIPMREGWVLLVSAPPPRPAVPAWQIWGSVLVVIGSALVSLALMTILVAKADHEKLLCRRIPPDIVRRLHGGDTVVKQYDNATICFIDIVSFTTMSGRMKAHEVMDMLQVLFREFDRLAAKHNCFNAETIGDAYLTISGGPDGEDAPTGARNIAAFALDAADVVDKLEFQGGKRIKIRLGVATGPVLAGVISTANVPKFMLFGETTSRAEEMESSSRPGKIQCSEETMKLLRGNFRTDNTFQCRGRKDDDNGHASGKTWWIVRAPGGNDDHAVDLDASGFFDVESRAEGSTTVHSSFTRSCSITNNSPYGPAYALSEKSSSILDNYPLPDIHAHQKDHKKGPAKTFWNVFHSDINIHLRSLGNMFKVAASNRRILLVTLLTFAILCGVGLAILFVFATEHEKHLYQDAVHHAKSADRWLGKEMSKALLPLFAMSELIKNVGKWNTLPYEIEGTQQYNVGGTVYNNVTGICDDPTYREPFVDIASSIKQSSEMQKILVNVQAAPCGVLCMTYPKNNTEDFQPGMFLDTTGAIGMNLIKTPDRAELSKAAIKAKEVTIQGPIKLVQQGNISDKHEALIARYPVFIDGHNFTVDGENYPFWGFTIVLLDWDKLKSMFGMYEFFARAEMEFQMTRYDSFNQRVAIVANSSKHEILQKQNSVSVKLESSDNAWTLIVGYEDGFSPPWLPLGTACVLVASFLASLLVMMVLAMSKMHKMLLYRMMPREAIRKLERGETFVERDSEATVFFSHLIGFQKMSGEMSAQDFLSMLNELYDAFDRLALKHKCTKIETIGAYYIVTVPGPERCGRQEREGVVRVALFALEVMEFVKNYQYKGIRPQIRAGFATGPIVSGAIGSGGVPKYTVFGDTVNLSSRMESTSQPMMIQCAHASFKLLRNSTEFDFEVEQRCVYVKGKGDTETFWVKGFKKTDCGNSFTSTRELNANGTNTMNEEEGDLILEALELDLEATGSSVKDKRVSFRR